MDSKARDRHLAHRCIELCYPQKETDRVTIASS